MNTLHRGDGRYRLRKAVSHLMVGMCVAAAFVAVALLLLLVGYLLSKGVRALDWRVFSEVPSGDVAAPGGLQHALLGSVVLLALAAVVGMPLGFFAGIYLAETRGARRRVAAVRFIADLLTGVPSIVVGILGYELLVVPMGHYSGIAGAMALAFIMIPIVARTTEEMLRLVPDTLREAALALGATQASTLFRVVLPTASGGVITGLMLALARVAGETAPLLFTALGSRLLTMDPTLPFPSLTVQIYAYATGPWAAQKDLAWAGILVLVVSLALLNLLVQLATRRA